MKRVPPSLGGRLRRDPIMMAATAAFSCAQFVRGLRPPKIPPALPVSRDLPLVVTEVRDEAEDVVSLRLAAPDGAVLPAWQPGSHLDVHLPSGRRRQYSLCGDPTDRRTFRIATRLIADGGGGSAEVHSLREGDALTVQGPRNAFPFLRHERYLFLAGGIGITPILPMARAAERAGAEYRMIYTGRTRASLPFLDELPSGAEVRTDDVDGLPDCAAWLKDAADTAVYCCGPAPMIEAVRTAFGAVDAGSLHYERFAPAPIVDGRAFEVRLARSGRTVRVAADESALTAVRRALPDVAYSCQQGFCGTCEVRVLGGEVERGNGDVGTDTMLICVSRAEAESLVIDL